MLLNGKRPMSPEVALRLARVFDTSARFWLNVRTEFELYEEGHRWSEQLQNLRQIRCLSKQAVTPLSPVSTT